MRTWIWIGVVLGCRAALVEAQTTDCRPPAISLIYQEDPVIGSHTTPELFAGMVETRTISVTPGRPGEVHLWGGIVSDLDGTNHQGVQGFSFMASTKGDVFIREVTTAGTVSDDAPEGIFRDGFRKVNHRVGDTSMSCPTSWAAGAIVFSFTEANTLEPRGTATFLALTVAASKEQGAEVLHGRLGWEDYPCQRCPDETAMLAADGEGACGQSTNAVVTVDGSSFSYCERRPLELTFVPRTSPFFKRGDSNDDGAIDISDAVRTLMFLFQDAAEPRCMDAADASDDGGVDITDPILILLDFFREGTGIPAPGPFECGIDPTPDRLSCREYPHCA